MAVGEKIIALRIDPDITMVEASSAELRTQVESCKPDPKDIADCKAALEHAKSGTAGDVKQKLDELLTLLETPVGTYSLDTLENTLQKEDEVGAAILGIYKLSIGNDLSKVFGDPYDTLLKPGQESLKLIFWDTIQSQFNFKGVMSASMTGMTSAFSGLTNIFGEDTTPDEESILLQSMQKNADSLDAVTSETQQEQIDGMVKIFDGLVGPTADTIQKLFKKTSTLNSEDRNSIFENPTILKGLIDTGMYNENGFSIDLKNPDSTIVVGDNNDINAIQQDFMASLTKKSTGLGDRAMKYKGPFDKIDKMLKDMGFENGLDAVKTMLGKLPVIGIFFKIMLGDTLDKFSGIKGLADVENVMKSLRGKRLTSMMDFKTNFLVNFEENHSTEINSPIGKLIANKGFTSKFFSSLGAGDKNFHTVMEGKNIPFEKKGFWGKILTGEGINKDDNTEFIYNQLKTTLDNSNLSEASLAQALNALSKEDVVFPPMANAAAAPAVAAAVAPAVPPAAAPAVAAAVVPAVPPAATVAPVAAINSNVTQ